MAQHDYVIANASGATVRADINNMALAISSNNSGSSAPSTTYAYLWWIDTSNNLLKLRNSANNAWITMPFSVTANNTVDINGGAIDGTPIGASSASTGAFTTLTATTFTSAGIDDNADATAITIDSAEKVGIGTAPDFKLHVSSTGTVLGLNATSGAVSQRFNENGTARFFLSTLNGSNGLSFVNGDGSSERMRIDASGRIGIGLTPSDHAGYVLQITGGSQSFITIGNNTTGTGALNGLVLGNDATGADIYQRENQPLRFHTNNTERARLDESGNLGIGQTSPEGKLHIEKASSGSTYSADGADQLILESNDSVAMDIRCPSSNTGLIMFSDNNARGRGQLAYYHSSDSMAFLTGATERLRINDVGNIGYGVTSVSSVLTGKTIQVGYGQISSDHVAYNYNTNFTNNAYQSGNDATFSAITSRAAGVIKLLEDKFIFMNASSGTAGSALSISEKMRIDSTSVRINGSTGYFGEKLTVTNDASYTMTSVRTGSGSEGHFVFRNSNGAVGTIFTNGTATAYNTSSDARLKDVTGEARGLEVINALNPVAYNWKADGKADEGLIAQEVLDIVPNAISGSEKDYYQMDYSKLVTHLVAGMKEQQEQIEQLKTEIQTLKGE